MSIPIKAVKLILDRPSPWFPEKPFKIKPRFAEFRSLTEAPELVQAIDQAMGYDPKNPLDEEALKTKDLLLAWKRIRENPAEVSLYCFSFRKKFKHVAIGSKKGYVYAYTFWNIFDMVKPFGRTFMMQGYFENPELSYYGPPPKSEWVQLQLDREIKTGRIATRQEYNYFRKFYLKAYKRMVDKRRILNLIWVPTWTRQGVTSIRARTKGTQELTKIVAESMGFMSEKLAKSETLEAEVNAQRRIESATRRELHESRDVIHRLLIEREQAERRERERARPSLQPPVHTYKPVLPSAPPPITGKIERALGRADWEHLANLGLFTLGIIVTGIGGMEYGRNPENWGGLALGILLFLASVIIFIYRQRTAAPPIEALKQKAEETVEEVRP